jgi:hypothetical protein
MCRDSSARNAVVVETDGLTGSGPDRGGYLVIRLGRWLGSEVERFSVGGGAQPLPSGGEFGSGQQRHRRSPVWPVRRPGPTIAEAVHRSPCGHRRRLPTTFPRPGPGVGAGGIRGCAAMTWNSITVECRWEACDDRGSERAAARDCGYGRAGRGRCWSGSRSPRPRRATERHAQAQALGRTAPA